MNTSIPFAENRPLRIVIVGAGVAVTVTLPDA